MFVEVINVSPDRLAIPIAPPFDSQELLVNEELSMVP